MIYLDHAATTPVPKAVADAMYEVLTGQFGNPSSQYPMGQEAKQLVEGCRSVIAKALGCQSKNLYFTSCGTESDNWAIQAAVWQGRHNGRHIITTAVEHSAVLESCKWLEKQGCEVTYLQPDKDGNIHVKQVENALREDTVLVTMMLVNNETGCLFPVKETAQLLKAKKKPAYYPAPSSRNIHSCTDQPEGSFINQHCAACAVPVSELAQIAVPRFCALYC